MADEPISAAPSSPAPASEAPATPSVVSEAPIPETPAPSASEAAPAVAPESPVAETVTETVAETVKEPSSLLSDAVPAPEPPKTDQTAEAPEAVKEGEAPAPEEARAEEAPLPTYDVFTVPEGVELEDAQVDKYVGILGATERAILAASGDQEKIHAAVQALGQQMLDQYTDEIASLGDRIAQVNSETFARAQEHWKNEFFEDPEIGGNRKDTTLRNCGNVINRFGGTPQQIAEVRQILSSTGAGNNRAVIRLLNNFASFLGEGSPVAGEKPEPQPQTRQERRYGKR